MDPARVQQAVLRRFGLRIDSHTGRYLLQSLAETPKPEQKLWMMGGEARTGVPRRLIVPAHDLREALQA